MLQAGSLKAAITTLHQGGLPVLVVVIDQQFAMGEALMAAQVDVLNHARGLGAEVWAVYPLPGQNKPAMEPQLGTATKSFRKKGFSVFAPETTPDFAAALDGQSAVNIVVMGHAVDQCVKLAAVGGYQDSLGKQWIDGIARRKPDWTVLTCAKILSGAKEHAKIDGSSWLISEPNVYCYADL